MLKAVTCDARHCCGNSTRAASAVLHAGYLLCVYLRPVSHAVRAHAGVDTITRDAPRHWLRTLRTPWRRTAPERAARLEGAASALATAQGRRAGEACPAHGAGAGAGGPWARRHLPCCECSSSPLPKLHCCCTAGTAYASTKHSAQCCQTDALTYHVITRGPRHGQTYPTPTLAAEKGATARGSPSELARAPARAPGPPRSRHARRGPHARAPTS